MSMLRTVKRLWYKDEKGVWQNEVDRNKRYIGYARSDIKSKDTPPWKKREKERDIAHYLINIERAKERVAWFDRKVRELM